MGITIYYFSGTGNSFSVAREVNSRITGSEIVPIPRALIKEEFDARGEVVGFVFPLYYLGMPDIVIKFIKKLDLSKTSYIFTIVTRGVDSSFSGGAIAQIERELHHKGKRLNAGFYLSMGDNFIIYWWGSTPKDILEKRLSEVDTKLDMIINSILNKQNTIQKNAADTLFPITKHLPLFGNKYYLRNTYNQDKYFYSDSNCIECGICEKVCPVKNISTENGKPQWLHTECQQCLACLHLCPSKSIQFGRRLIQFGNDTTRKDRYHHPNVNLNDIFID